jgi:ornithine cyclodeaminase/alanine dehydrogenase-like protein (mu-crystallin family)
MDATLISSVRTGGIAGVAAKYLANPDAAVLGMIGSGAQARSQLMAMAEVLPRLAEIRVFSPTREHRERYVREMGELYPFRLLACETAEEAMRDADILVTATSTQAPLLKARWVKPGSFYSHVAGWEDEFEVAQQADKIVVDDWEMTKHRGSQTLARMYREKLITDDRIHANLEEIVCGEKPGRERPDERVYFSSVGLSILDTAIAMFIYREALARGVGTPLKLWDKPIWFWS